MLRHFYPLLDPMSLTFEQWAAYLDRTQDIRDMNSGEVNKARQAQRLAALDRGR